MTIIKRIIRMHSSAILVLPKPVCWALQIAPGYYVQIDTDSANRTAVLRKITPGEPAHARDQGNPPEPDR